MLFENADGVLVEKVEKDVINLKGLSIKIKYTVNAKDLKGCIKPRINTRDYKSSKYVDHHQLTEARIAPEVYLILDFIKDDKHNEILFNLNHIFKLKRLFRVANSWFDYNSNVFEYDDNDILRVNPSKDESCLISNLIQNRALMIEPAVIISKGIRYEGAKLYYNEKSNFIYLTADQVCMLHDLIKGINLHNESLITTGSLLAIYK